MAERTEQNEKGGRKAEDRKATKSEALSEQKQSTEERTGTSVCMGTKSLCRWLRTAPKDKRKREVHCFKKYNEGRQGVVTRWIRTETETATKKEREEGKKEGNRAFPLCLDRFAFLLVCLSVCVSCLSVKVASVCVIPICRLSSVFLSSTRLRIHSWRPAAFTLNGSEQKKEKRKGPHQPHTQPFMVCVSQSIPQCVSMSVWELVYLSVSHQGEGLTLLIPRSFGSKEPRLFLPSLTSRKSINLPGVAMQISTPSWRSRAWGNLGTPPYTHVFLIFEDLPNLSHSALICTASSRVGASTRTMGPSPRFRYGWALMCTIEGSRNAQVFPDPVSAIPIMSRPDSATGQPWT
mmetsp:Transcript_13120/g.25790  ORF Transcript_13120/g.25790 Transcript_13120/m.25790 type:complete len:349 (-) Transcript_13120:590-1636(-)